MDTVSHVRFSLRVRLHASPVVAAALVATAIVGVPGRAPAVCTAPPGDLNGSGQSNVVDVVCGVLTALWKLRGMTGPVPACLAGANWRLADANCDGVVDGVDVQMLAFNAVGLPLSSLLDANGDGRADLRADTTPLP